jgi:hypothetical protein
MQDVLFKILQHYSSYLVVFEYGKDKDTPHYHIIIEFQEQKNILPTILQSHVENRIKESIKSIYPYYITRVNITNIDDYIEYIMKDKDSNYHIRISKGNLHGKNIIPFNQLNIQSIYDVVYIENTSNPVLTTSKYLRHNIIKYC